MAARNIVVLADGTGNSAAKAFKTNVWRLYEALDLNGANQIAVFSDGVGTSTFKPFQVVGLALGFGVKRRVLALYKFLCLNCNKDDQIYAFGFSRGAYTIRVLVGLIHKEGLVAFDSREELDRNALAAYRAFRKREFSSKLPWISALRQLRDSRVRWWNGLTGGRNYSAVRPKEGDWRAAKNVKIHFLGLWDTVAAYGLPVDELTRAVDRWVWPMSFRERNLPSSVKRGRQAFSIDDERRTFFPIRWNENNPADLESIDGAPPRLRQVWFAGAHANVGGGYPDDRLAHIPLCWMIGEASESGLRFKPEIVADYWDEASESGRLYDSRSGFGVFYRYHPRSVGELMGKGITPLVDASAIIRIAKGSDGYGPIALPDEVNILTPYDQVVSLDQLGSSVAAVTPMRPDKLPYPPDRARDLRAMDQSLRDAARRIVLARCPDRPERVELMRDSVWWGRTLYYVTLIIVLLAALYPLIAGYLVIEQTAYVTDGLKGLIGPLAGLAKGFLPGFSAPWLEAIVANPVVAIGLGLAIGICLWLGSFARIRIYDLARAVWNIDVKRKDIDSEESRAITHRRIAANGSLILLSASILSLTVTPLKTSAQFVTAAALFAGAVFCAARAIYLAKSRKKRPQSLPPVALRFARAIRTNPAAIGLYDALRTTWLPAAFLALTSALLLFAVNKGTFEVANSMGQICPEPGPKMTGSGEGRVKWASSFETISPCTDTGIELTKGLTYRIEIEIPQGARWLDGGENYCADVLGVTENLSWREPARYMYLFGTLAKRWWIEPYFRPIARIGRRGSDEYALTPVKFPSKKRDQCPIHELSALITARETGQLYLYVNDVGVGLPGHYDAFYRNNKGTGKIMVSEVGLADIVPTIVGPIH
jgi:uncharacterized protein (DUF2235 family)